MNATRMPFYTGILVELCFCMLMTQWMNESDHPVSPLFTLAEGTIIQVQQSHSHGGCLRIAGAIWYLKPWPLK
jgi:hypothetical protein